MVAAQCAALAGVACRLVAVDGAPCLWEALDAATSRWEGPPGPVDPDGSGDLVDRTYSNSRSSRVNRHSDNVLHPLPRHRLQARVRQRPVCPAVLRDASFSPFDVLLGSGNGAERCKHPVQHSCKGRIGTGFQNSRDDSDALIGQFDSGNGELQRPTVPASGAGEHLGRSAGNPPPDRCIELCLGHGSDHLVGHEIHEANKKMTRPHGRITDF